MSDAMNHQYIWEVVGSCDTSKPKSIELPTRKEDFGQVTLKIHTHCSGSGVGGGDDSVKMSSDTILPPLSPLQCVWGPRVTDSSRRFKI